MLAFVLSSPFPPGEHFDVNLYQRPANSASIARALATIPPDAAVSAQSGLAAHLSHRQKISEFPLLGDSEYVIVDLNGFVARPYQDVFDARIAELPAQGFRQVWAEGDVRVYWRE